MDSVNPDISVTAAAISRPPRVWKFWGTALWGLFIFAAMFIGQVAPLLAIVVWKAGKIDLAEAINVAGDGRALALTVIGGLPAVLLAIWLPVHLSRTPFKEYLALRWTTWQNVVIGIAAMIVMVEGWDLLSKATGHEVTAGFMGDIMKSVMSDGVLWLAVLAFAVVAPLTRGIAGARISLSRLVGEFFAGAGRDRAVVAGLDRDARAIRPVFSRRGVFDRAGARLRPLPQPIDLANDAAAWP